MHKSGVYTPIHYTTLHTISMNLSNTHNVTKLNKLQCLCRANLYEQLPSSLSDLRYSFLSLVSP
jgi:hypothetical protein